MKIEKLSEHSIKIVLEKRDISSMGIAYDSWDTDMISDFLLTLSNNINITTGIDISCQKLYVEIFSREDRCLIFVSCMPKSRKKTKAVKMCCQFADYTSLKQFCCRLREKMSGLTVSSSLYYNSSFLRLMVEIPWDYKECIKNIISSGFAFDCDSMVNAYNSEYFQCCERLKAIEKICG